MNLNGFTETRKMWSMYTSTHTPFSHLFANENSWSAILLVGLLIASWSSWLAAFLPLMRMDEQSLQNPQPWWASKKFTILRPWVNMENPFCSSNFEVDSGIANLTDSHIVFSQVQQFSPPYQWHTLTMNEATVWITWVCNHSLNYYVLTFA